MPEALAWGPERNHASQQKCGSGYAFDIGQQQAAAANGTFLRHHPRPGPAKVGKPGEFSCDWHPSAGSPKPSQQQSKGDNLSATGFGQQAVADHEQPDRDDPDDENDQLRLTELPGKQEDPLEKVVTTARHAEKAG